MTKAKILEKLIHLEAYTSISSEIKNFDTSMEKMTAYIDRVNIQIKDIIKEIEND